MSLNIIPYPTRSGLDRAISANEGGFALAIKYIQVSKGKQAVYPEDDGCANVETLKDPVGYVEVLHADRVSPYQWQLVIDLVGLLDIDWNLAGFAACDADKNVIAIYGDENRAIYPVTQALDNALLAVNLLLGVFPADSIVIEHHNLPLELFQDKLEAAILRNSDEISNVRDEADQAASAAAKNNTAVNDRINKQAERIESTENKQKELQQQLDDSQLAMYSQTLARRMMYGEIMQPGLVSMRAHGDKSDGYQVEFEADYANFGVDGLHDHPDVIYKPGGTKAYTLGMPEAMVNLRELQRWRHVDPSLITPVTNGGWLQTKRIDAPNIPTAILAKSTPAEQIAEARKWMQAFANNDPSIRDFRPYCKSILLYAESWDQLTQADDPSPSFRHTADSTNVADVTAQAAIYTGMGMKGVFENKNHPVTNLMNGKLVTTAWRMLAVELGTLNDYSPEDSLYLNFDPAVASRHGLDEVEIEDSRYAHYAVRQIQGAGGVPYGAVRNQTLLGQWMRKVPGLSNGKNLPLELDEPGAGRYAMHDPLSPDLPLNAGYYTNYASIPDDAVGRNIFRFGWREPTKFVALTDHAEVMPFTDPYSGITHRWSEALPWEFVILGWWNNPEWNPYQIKWLPRAQVTGNGSTAATAYTGWNEDHRGFLLPVELFDAASIKTDPADTGNGAKWVVCGDGVPRRFVAAGMRIFTLAVDGKKARTRYPIMPLAHHGNPVYQWLRAERRASDDIRAGVLRNSIEIAAQRDAIRDAIDAMDEKLTASIADARNQQAADVERLGMVDDGTAAAVIRNAVQIGNILDEQEI